MSRFHHSNGLQNNLWNIAHHLIAVSSIQNQHAQKRTKMENDMFENKADLCREQSIVS